MEWSIQSFCQKKSTAADAGSAVTATMPATQLALITERASFFH